MSNLDKWEKLFKTQKWKYKRVKTKWQESLMIKTYNKTDRCHIFVSETKVNFSFFKKGRAKFDKEIVNRNATTACMSFRNDSLHIYAKTRLMGFRNLGTLGPSFLNELVHRITKNSINRNDTEVIRRTSRRKFKMIMDFYYRLNGKKPDTIINMCYPGLKNMPFEIPIPISAAVLRNRNVTFDQYVKKVYKYNSKPIKKAVLGELNSLDLTLVHSLSRRFNRGELEKLIDIINIRGGLFPAYGSLEPRHTKQMKRFFSHYSNNKVFKILKDNDVARYLKDSIRQWGEHSNIIICPQEFKDIKDLHDKISIEYRKAEQADYTFKIPKSLEKIDGIEVDDTKIVIPKTRHQLLEWGQKMNNCIGSYHSDFNTGRVMLIGIEHDNEIKYNIEIQNGKLIQFSANRNRSVGSDVSKKYLDVFKEYKLLNKGA